jgi:mannose-6-phosphate isomerase-like protein (cupin superfamily)
MTERHDPFIARIGDGTPSRWSDGERGRIAFYSLFNEVSENDRRLTSGVAVLEPRTGALNPHRHAQPEIYVILEGAGILTLGEHEYPVLPGNVVYLKGSIRHGIRNEASVELRLFYVLAADGFDDVEYDFHA